MQQIGSHIEYLLDHHDCVIVPGFGAFLKHDEPALIDEGQRTIIPPRRTISFNRELSYDDGLLSNSFSRAQQIPYTTATNIIRKEVEYIIHTIENGGTINIGSLGNISSAGNNILIFSPCESLYTSMGYKSIQTMPVSSRITVPDKTDISAITPLSGFAKRVHAVMKYAAMFILLVSVAIILSTPLSPDSSPAIIKATLNPVDILSEPTADDVDNSLVPIFYIAEPSAKETTSNGDIIENANYCLVIASLANTDQANKFMTEAGEDALGYIESNGRYRVYATTGPTIESVMNAELISRYPEAWPCQMSK